MAESQKKELSSQDALKSWKMGLFVFTVLTLNFTCWCQSQSAITLDPTAWISDEQKLLVEGTDGLYGWSFRLTSPVTATGFGFFDQDKDGLNHAHTITLWMSTTSSDRFPFIENPELVTALTVPSGTSATLDGPWRKVELPAALTLEPGGYAITSTYNFLDDDSVKLIFTRYIPDAAESRFQIGGPSYTRGSDFTAPAATYFYLESGVELGPTLFVQSIPEPSAVVLLTLSAAAWCGRRCLSGHS